MNNPGPFKLAVVSAGTSDPSSTRLLADRTAERAVALAARHHHAVTVSVVELRELAADISTALTSQLITPKLQSMIVFLEASAKLLCGLQPAATSAEPGRR